MPTKTGKTYSSYYPNDLAINQSSGVGIDSTTRTIQDGLGNNTAISLSDDVLQVQPQNDDTTGAMLVKNQSGSSILSVDTASSLVKAGASQINCLTLHKSMGLFDFSPTEDYHHPLIANNMLVPTAATAFVADSGFGNGADPATTLDISAGTVASSKCIAVFWYLENDITLDSIRYMLSGDGTNNTKMHIYAYDIDTSTGDLSAGALHAHLHNLTVLSTAVKVGTVPIDTANIDASKVVIGFISSTDSTNDISVSYNIKYHIR